MSKVGTILSCPASNIPFVVRKTWRSGFFSLATALDFPGRVRKLVLVGRPDEDNDGPPRTVEDHYAFLAWGSHISVSICFARLRGDFRMISDPTGDILS
jgi:pimeloyl-ACP methyl ester carboxylesterase